MTNKHVPGEKLVTGIVMGGLLVILILVLIGTISRLIGWAF